MLLKQSNTTELPPELDFFKYAQGGSSKRKQIEDESQNDHSTESKKPVKRVRHAEKDDTSGDQNATQHRVTAKGSNVPESCNSFEGIQEKYKISPRVIQNLVEYGYTSPTAIQAHAIPILLAVRFHTMVF